jgi:transcriptional regulator with XRE-family HTH domain
MRKKYTTLDNETFSLEGLSMNEKAILGKAFALYAGKTDWNQFSNYYIGEICKLYGSLPRKEITKKPIYKICTDLEMRLGIEQGQTRLPDYRDLLEAIIDCEFSSRYQFCKKNNISQDTLSRILNKKREPSIQLLNMILDSLGYELTFKRKQTLRPPSRAASRKESSLSRGIHALP